MGRETLIDRYLDQLATPGEMEELGLLLVADPTLADELARAAHAEALIEDHFRERAAQSAALAVAAFAKNAGPDAGANPRSWRTRLRAWAVAAALLLALGTVGGVLAYRHSNGRPVLEDGPRPSLVVSGQLLVDGALADRALDGARLEVAGDNAAVLRLPDGSRAELAPGSVAVTRRPEGVRGAVELDRGLATFHIEEGDQHFRVDTPLGRVTALAGGFTVELQSVEEEEQMSGRGALLLIVASLVGHVEVESMGQQYVLAAGQSVALASEAPASAAKPARKAKPAFAGTIVVVSADGKTLTLESPPDKKDGKAIRRQFKLSTRSEVIYFGVPRDGQKPTLGYAATVWLQEGSSDTIALIKLGQKGVVLNGVVTAVSADGKTITLNLGPSKPGAPTSAVVKIVPETKVVYHEAEKGNRPTIGYFVSVWLQAGSRDNASGISFSSKKPTKPTKPAVGTPPGTKPAKEKKAPDTRPAKPVKGTKPLENKPTLGTRPAAPAPFVVVGPPRPARDVRPISALIDEEISKRMTEARIPASPPADDAEFLRRVTLDLTGRLPTYDQTVAFLADRSPDKRRRVIDELLASPAYGEHFATIWRLLLAPPPVATTKVPRDNLSPWLAEQFNAGRGWDAIVNDLLTAEGTIAQSPQSAFLLANGENFQPQPNLVAASSARFFLGTQLRCAECHNHPFARWTQADFWGTAAFFARLRFSGYKGGQAPTLSEAPEPGASITIPASAGSKAGQTVKARFLGGAEARLEGTEPARPRFAAWVTSADNPYFARAAVNRAWAHFFGRGLVSPVDDIDANEPSHPALLTRLAREYAAGGFDHKYLARAICNSKAYQRTSKPVAGNEADTLFSHMALKPLSPEALYDALAEVLSMDRRAPRTSGKPAGKAGELAGLSRQDFVRAFRSPASSDDAVEQSPGVPQRLQLMNGQLLNRGAPVVDRLVESGASREEAINTLYLTVLSRRATAEEVKIVSGYLARRRDVRAGYSGALWMLLNSSEFALNH